MARLVIVFGGNGCQTREDERGDVARADGPRGRGGARDRPRRPRPRGHPHPRQRPQVGALAMQQASGEPEVPAMPLYVLDAMTQGQIGYLSIRRSRRRPVAADRCPALARHRRRRRPRVRFGFRPSRSDHSSPRTSHNDLAKARGWDVTPRTPVAAIAASMGLSREPKGFVEIDAVAVPARRRPCRHHGRWRRHPGRGAAATTALSSGHRQGPARRARGRARRPRAGYGHRRRRRPARLRQAHPQRAMPLADAEERRHLADGQFPEGSMGPKCGAPRFVAGGGSAVITDAAHRRPRCAATTAQTASCRTARASVFAPAPVARGSPCLDLAIAYATPCDSRASRAGCGDDEGVSTGEAAMATPANSACSRRGRQRRGRGRRLRPRGGQRGRVGEGVWPSRSPPLVVAAAAAARRTGAAAHLAAVRREPISPSSRSPASTRRSRPTGRCPAACTCCCSATRPLEDEIALKGCGADAAGW